MAVGLGCTRLEAAAATAAPGRTEVLAGKAGAAAAAAGTEAAAGLAASGAPLEGSKALSPGSVMLGEAERPEAAAVPGYVVGKGLVVPVAPCRLVSPGFWSLLRTRTQRLSPSRD